MKRIFHKETVTSLLFLTLCKRVKSPTPTEADWEGGKHKLVYFLVDWAENRKSPSTQREMPAHQSSWAVSEGKASPTLEYLLSTDKGDPQPIVPPEKTGILT